MTLAIVTGSSAGIGFQVAAQLADQGFNRVVVTSRSFARAKDAADRLTSKNPGIEFLPYELQLHDLEQVQAFATRVSAEQGRWNLLVNNAGAKIEAPTKLTRQGFEWHYGVNHLAHFALTSWLRTSAEPGARVVSNASIVARKGNPKLWQDSISVHAAEQYAASKLANLCFAMQLAKLGTLEATAAHPGFTRAEPYGNRIVRAAEYAFAQNSRLGAMPIVEAASKTVPSGSYLGPRHLELWGKPKLISVPKIADDQACQYLFQLSEQQLGFSF